MFKPDQVLERVDEVALCVLLKRPENQDTGFRELLDTLLANVVELRSGLKG
jgi:hypothetical protein